MLGSSTMNRVASILAIASLPMFASTHMFIASPIPIPGSCPKDPLEASGSNFPCHGVTLPSSGGQKMAAGSSQELSFALGGGANTAVHGGGSCQLSLLYDISKASDPSAWKVIYSIEGGCPANSVGNLANATQCASEDQGECVHSFQYHIPAGVKSGNAILSWTWFNTIGNREMYQNCAAVDIDGGSGDEMDSLPAMYVANIAPLESCSMTASTNLGFPNPGKYKTTVIATNGTNWPIATPTAAGCAAGGASASPIGYGSGSDSASPASPAPSSSAYAAPTSSASASFDASDLPPAYQTTQPAQTATNDQPAATATTMMTVTASSPASYAPYSAASSAAAPSAAAPSGYSSGSPASSNASDSSSGSSGSVSCTNDGAVVCIGSTQFGLCNAGTAVPQPLAPGTSCSNGVISKRRVVRHAARHIAGRRHSHNF